MSFAAHRARSFFRRRPLRCETLERRSVPAGNLVATFVDGNLQVFGDDQNNSVEITAVGEDLIVRGSDDTRINGQSEVSFSTGATALGDLRVVLGSGRDQLFAHDLAVGGSAAIGLGQVDTIFDAGNDRIELDHVAIGGDLRLNAGGGADIVILTSVTVVGEAALRTGSGADHLQIIDSALNRLTANAGSGNDLVDIESSLVAEVAVRMGTGDDTLSILGSSVLGSNPFLDGGAGRDRLRLADDAILVGVPIIHSFERRVRIV